MYEAIVYLSQSLQNSSGTGDSIEHISDVKFSLLELFKLVDVCSTVLEKNKNVEQEQKKLSHISHSLIGLKGQDHLYGPIPI